MTVNRPIHLFQILTTNHFGQLRLLTHLTLTKVFKLIKLKKIYKNNRYNSILKIIRLLMDG